MKEIHELIDQHEVISFDIWDTLIHRRVGAPSGIFFILQGELAQTDLALLYPSVIDSFVYMRRESEAAARREAFKERSNYEVSIYDIYDVFSELAGIPTDKCKLILEREIELEKEHIYADKEMLDAFKYAQYKGKIITIISDMYLPASILHGFIADLGFKIDIGNMHVSCDEGGSKHDGKLFEKMKNYYAGMRLLHIGDNPWSDIAQAENYNINNYHHTYLHPDTTYVYQKSHVIDLIKGISQTVQSNYTDKEKDPFRLMGATIFGPWMVGFVSYVLNNSKHLDDLLFFSRDGELMSRMARILAPDANIHYVGASRAALLKPALFNTEIHKLAHMINPDVKKTVADSLKVYGLTDPSKYMSAIKRAGFKDESSVVIDRLQFVRLLLSINPDLQEVAIEHVPNTEKYFDKFIGKKIGVVDYGWYATSQINLSRILNLRKEHTEIHGFYYHIIDLQPGPHSWRASTQDYYRSYLVDTVGENDANVAFNTYLHQAGIPVMEAMLSEPVGTILQYTEDGCEREEDFYHPQEDSIRSLQLGVEDFVKEFAKLCINTEHIASYDWMRPFIRLIEFPTKEEALLLGPIEHGAAAGSLDGKTDTLAEEFYNLTPEAYDIAEKDAQWQQAFRVLNTKL